MNIYLNSIEDISNGNASETKANKSFDNGCAAGFALLNLPKGKSLGRSKPETNSYAQALATQE
jgi:hypothetical protein